MTEVKKRNSRVTNPTTYSGLGKLPPQDVQAEEFILGTLLIADVEVPETIVKTIKPDFFYRDVHKKIFNAILLLVNEKTAIDLATVSAKLRQLGELEMVGGVFYITELTNNGKYTHNIQKHILIIHEMFLKRELIRIGTEIINGMYEDTEDPLQAIKTIVQQVKDLERGIFKREEKGGEQLAKEALIEMLTEKPNGLLGVSTGIQGMDYVMKGFQRGHLVVLPAATSMGKSLLMCSLAKNALYNANNELLAEQKPTAIFSLEMKSVELTFRLMGNIADIEVEHIQLNTLTEAQKQHLNYSFKVLEKAQIYIDDTPGISIDELEIKIATLVALYSVREVYIDYIQLIRYSKDIRNREEGFSDVSKRLKILAGELDITIIVLSQVTDDVKNRFLKIPLSDDIKYCKSIANDADLVAFLWRAEYYSDVLDTLNEKYPDGLEFPLFGGFKINDYKNVAFLIITKNRSGKLGKVPLHFAPEKMRISDNWHVKNFLESNVTQDGAMFTTESRQPKF